MCVCVIYLICPNVFLTCVYEYMDTGKNIYVSMRYLICPHVSFTCVYKYIDMGKNIHASMSMYPSPVLMYEHMDMCYNIHLSRSDFRCIVFSFSISMYCVYVHARMYVYLYVCVTYVCEYMNVGKSIHMSMCYLRCL